MRRVFLAISLLIIFALAGCSRIESPATVKVVFAVGGVSSGQMDTKATFTQFLRTIQPLSQPTLLIESQADRSFYVEVAAGEQVELPVGNYDITATYKKSVIGSVGGRAVSEEPIYDINESVTVRADKTIYYLTGIYQCWALGINYMDTQKYLMDGSEYNFVNDDIGEKGVLFISTVETGIPWQLISYPKDNANYEARTYTIGDNDAGYWYCYSPVQRETASGVFVVNLPDFESH